MKQYATDQIRNVVLLSQKGAGKTSLTEAFLYSSGATSRMGRVEDGNTLSDHLPDEIARSMSLSLSILGCEWKKAKINVIDAPGDLELVGEILSGIRAAGCAVVVLDATAGVQVGTELAWKHAQAAALPAVFFVNRMDRDNADFEGVVASLKEAFGPVVPLQLPYGGASEFTGIVDLVSQSGVSFNKGKSQKEDVPDRLAGRAAELREELLEAVASVDDDLTEKYLNDEEIAPAEFLAALKKGVRERKLFPVLCGSAVRNLGAAELLDVLSEVAPSPADLGVRPDGKLRVICFKTMVDPTMGRLSYLQVVGGKLTANTQLRNPTRKTDERIGQLSYPRGKEHDPAEAVVAGDICTVAKLSATLTGDSLFEDRAAEPLPGIPFPQPPLAVAISPKTKTDLDKMGAALARMAEEDPTLHVTREEATNESLLWGMGDGHVHMAVERMQRKFGTQVDTSVPKVPYKETIKKSSTAQGRFKRQTGGHGQFGDVTIVLEPLPLNAGEFEFENAIKGGVISKNFIPAVEKGVHEAMAGGVLAGFPVVGCKVRLIDGKMHEVDSSDQAFHQAGAIAFREAAKDAAPTMLEPVHELKVRVPDAFTGAIIGDLNTKRAHVSGTDQGADGETIITAQAPLAEVQRYAVDLRQITQGRGSFTSKFVRYHEVPAHLHQGIIAAAGKHTG